MIAFIASHMGCSGAGSSGGKKFFVSSATFSGALGGLAGADAKCNTAAQAASLPGTFIAWLSDSHTDAIQRVQDVGPWSLVVGPVVFNNKASLTTGPIAPPGQDEHGHPLLTRVWTGTAGGGVMGTSICNDWTSAAGSDFGIAGDSTSTSSSWTSSNGRPSCADTYPIYCLEQ
jgi:hypothetical protein